MFKFGLNEFFKDFYTKFIGEQTLEDSLVTRLSLWAVASGSAGMFVCHNLVVSCSRLTGGS